MYPGFVFGFTDNKNNCLLCRRSSYQPNISDCTHAAWEAIVKPLSAFCLCARSDAKPGKALSPVVVILPCRIKWSDFFCKNHGLIQTVTFTENITVVFYAL